MRDGAEVKARECHKPEGELAARYILNLLLVCTCMLVFFLSTASLISGALKTNQLDCYSMLQYIQSVYLNYLHYQTKVINSVIEISLFCSSHI